MGVTGSGKTTIGKLLSKEINYKFHDGDNLHSSENIEKMKKGIPLEDNDREGWLNSIKELIYKENNIIISCSALKESYRQLLMKDKETTLIYLKGDFDLIKERLDNRKDHFMNPNLLKSQFDTLEEPKNAIYVDVSHPPKNVIKHIKNKLNFS